jgi:hypothetical protein
LSKGAEEGNLAKSADEERGQFKNRGGRGEGVNEAKV